MMIMATTTRHWTQAWTMSALGLFVALTFWAKWNPVQADDTPAKPPVITLAQLPKIDPAKKGVLPSATEAKGDVKGKAKAKAKGKGEGSAQVKTVPSTITGPVPGTGQKLDAAAIAKIIDQEVAKRLKEE